MSASERKRDGDHAQSFDEFKNRVNNIGLSEVEILKPICYWGISFWDYCVWSDKETSRLEESIHKILFPTIEFEYSDYCRHRGLNEEDKRIFGRWLNKKCDVLIMWSHIWYKGDIFVTRDKRFLNTKKPELVKLGANEILCPDEAVSILRQLT
jgi:hypothetical protein